MGMVFWVEPFLGASAMLITSNDQLRKYQLVGNESTRWIQYQDGSQGVWPSEERYPSRYCAVCRYSHRPCSLTRPPNNGLMLVHHWVCYQ